MGDRDKSEESQAGFAVYSERMLRWYDFLVHRISNHLVWKCPTRKLFELYRSNVAKLHLEIGVGTGIFLDRIGPRFHFDHLTLADANPNCLASASLRLARYQPEIVELNLLRKGSFSSLDGKQFDSIGLNYVLHCLPNGLENLPLILPRIKHHLTASGVLFGSTILGAGIRKSWLAGRVMKFYNQREIFGNERDTLQQLDAGLRQHFPSVEVRQIGCVALFQTGC